MFAWYAKHGRNLAFRATRDPYRIWVSEVMLQQTTVAAVMPYYERFLAAFPTVAVLAAAAEHDVLRLWEGLGYYSRARNLHATAGRIVAEHGGAFPRTAAELAALRGIGRYTAGAIASFAFDAPAPIVEANTLRLYCRLLGYTGNPRGPEGQRRLWEFAGRIVPKADAGRFNHALMDLGATVCTVKNPGCETCPVAGNCTAFRLGTENSVPVAKVRAAVTEVIEAYVIVQNAEGRYLLRRRAAGERWAGLWDFPRCELLWRDAAGLRFPEIGANRQKPMPLGEGVPPEVASRLADAVESQSGVRVTVGEPFAELRHAVTRFRIRLVCFTAERNDGGPLADGSRWVERTELASLALSRAGRKVADALGN